MEGFEERLKKLEELAEQIRNREIPLEQAMALYEEGSQLAKGLETELRGFEQRIEILANELPPNGEGEPDLQPF
ncbi:MAG: exodeoxyribonuclease VII small subunit [Spirochaetales bacterium]|nr:exodeoxyribonuclease VII small subunit [Spirochaetales bacterium]